MSKRISTRPYITVPKGEIKSVKDVIEFIDKAKELGFDVLICSTAIDTRRGLTADDVISCMRSVIAKGEKTASTAATNPSAASTKASRKRVVSAAKAVDSDDEVVDATTVSSTVAASTIEPTTSDESEGKTVSIVLTPASASTDSKKSHKEFNQTFKRAYKRWKRGKINQEDFRAIVGCCYRTLVKYIKYYEDTGDVPTPYQKRTTKPAKATKSAKKTRKVVTAK